MFNIYDTIVKIERVQVFLFGMDILKLEFESEFTMYGFGSEKPIPWIQDLDNLAWLDLH